MTACQERRTRRSALRFGGVVRESESFPCELIDPFGPRAAERAAAIATEFAEPKIVDVKEQYVRPVCHLIFLTTSGVSARESVRSASAYVCSKSGNGQDRSK